MLNHAPSPPEKYERNPHPWLGAINLRNNMSKDYTVIYHSELAFLTYLDTKSHKLLQDISPVYNIGQDEDSLLP